MGRLNFLSVLGPFPETKLPSFYNGSDFIDICDTTIWAGTPCQTLYFMSLRAEKKRRNVFGMEPGNSTSFVDHVTNFSTKLDEFQMKHYLNNRKAHEIFHSTNIVQPPVVKTDILTPPFPYTPVNWKYSTLPLPNRSRNLVSDELPRRISIDGLSNKDRSSTMDSQQRSATLRQQFSSTSSKDGNSKPEKEKDNCLYNLCLPLLESLPKSMKSPIREKHPSGADKQKVTNIHGVSESKPASMKTSTTEKPPHSEMEKREVTQLNGANERTPKSMKNFCSTDRQYSGMDDPADVFESTPKLVIKHPNTNNQHSTPHAVEKRFVKARLKNVSNIKQNVSSNDKRFSVNRLPQSDPETVTGALDTSYPVKPNSEVARNKKRTTTKTKPSDIDKMRLNLSQRSTSMKSNNHATSMTKDEHFERSISVEENDDAENHNSSSTNDRFILGRRSDAYHFSHNEDNGINQREENAPESIEKDEDENIVLSEQNDIDQSTGKFISDIRSHTPVKKSNGYYSIVRSTGFQNGGEICTEDLEKLVDGEDESYSAAFNLKENENSVPNSTRIQNSNEINQNKSCIETQNLKPKKNIQKSHRKTSDFLDNFTKQNSLTSEPLSSDFLCTACKIDAFDSTRRVVSNEVELKICNLPFKTTLIDAPSSGEAVIVSGHSSNKVKGSISDSELQKERHKMLKKGRVDNHSDEHENKRKSTGSRMCFDDIFEENMEKIRDYSHVEDSDYDTIIKDITELCDKHDEFLEKLVKTNSKRKSKGGDISSNSHKSKEFSRALKSLTNKHESNGLVPKLWAECHNNTDVDPYCRLTPTLESIEMDTPMETYRIEPVIKNTSFNSSKEICDDFGAMDSIHELFPSKSALFISNTDDIFDYSTLLDDLKLISD